MIFLNGDPFIAADHLPRPIGCASVNVGVGKTEAAVQSISMLLKQLIICKHGYGQSELKAVYAVPTHKLGQELVQRFEARGVIAGVWRGRLADNPEKPSTKMCLKPAEVAEVSGRGLPIQQSMCRVKIDDIHYTCERYEDCPYQMQADRLSKADVVIVTHASLFFEMPSIGLRQILVIDEGFWPAGLRGVGMMDDRIFITFDDMENLSDLLVEAGVASSFERSELHFMWLHLQNALKELPPGNLERSKLLALFSLRRIDDAIELEWRLIGATTIYPGMKSDVFAENIDKSPNYKKAMIRIKVWKALKALICEDGPEKSGWLIITQDKKGRKALQLRWREDIKVGWGDFVVVTMDATQDEQVVAPYFDRPLQQLPSNNVALEHVSVLQVVDRSFGASSLIPDGGKDGQRRKNRAREIYQWICLRAIQYRGQGQDGIDVLVVCQQGLEELIRAWGLADNVDIAHFNAIRGLDNWGGVACQIVIGRLMPKPADVEDHAEALTGRAVDKRLSSGDWYPKQTVGIRLADGSGWAVENDRHPDPLTEKIRYQICEGELIQAIGRSRGVNRTPETPLQLDILTNVCLPLVVHQPIRWEDHAPDNVEAMLLHGMMVGSFKDTSVIYSDLFPTEDAARKIVVRRSKLLLSNVPIPDIPHYICTIWGLSGIGSTIAATYTPALATFRRGDRSTVIPVIFDPHQIADPAAWLSARLGVDVQVIRGPEANAEWAKRQKRKAGRK